MVMKSSESVDGRTGIARINTMANQQNGAGHKVGRKMVACQPGIIETAKSKLTIVCTESTKGVESPASSK